MLFHCWLALTRLACDLKQVGIETAELEGVKGADARKVLLADQL